MTRYRPEKLADYAQHLLAATGLEPAHARRMGSTLIDAELLGHSSHGLALLPRYMDELTDGGTTKTGNPELLRDNGSNLTLDGHHLPGAVVMHSALDMMLERTARHGLVTAAIRRSQHIGCLSAYLERATSQGQIILILSSNPQARIVAPFGGTRAAYSPNPLACGIPTRGDPILIDTSMSSVSYNKSRQYRDRGEMLAEDYLLDAQGRPTNDPNALFDNPPGAIRPFGGEHLGYKGFALGIMIEAFTSGLAGFGRSDEPGVASNAVFLLVADPAAFGGADFLVREMSYFADLCLQSSDDPSRVHMPGQRAIAHRLEALRNGIDLKPAVAAALATRAAALGLPTPEEALDIR